MRRLGRIALIFAFLVVIVIVAVEWSLPVALSIRTARTATDARIVPVQLADKSISQAPGKKLSYFGYNFEVPWTDLDETKTKQLIPNVAHLSFQSGLTLTISRFPPREFTGKLSGSMNVQPQGLANMVGPEGMKSDYDFLRTVYEFSPDKMHYWSLSPSLHYREMMMVTMKSVMLSGTAQTGMFYVQNQSFRGFQKGNPVARPPLILVSLYSDDGGIALFVNQKDYRDPKGVSQAELNRIIQSLTKQPTAKEQADSQPVSLAH